MREVLDWLEGFLLAKQSPRKAGLIWNAAEGQTHALPWLYLRGRDGPGLGSLHIQLEVRGTIGAQMSVNWMTEVTCSVVFQLD